MELRINDYVRTKYGINKILSNPENHIFNIDIFKKDRITLRCIRKKDVIKSSPNIIDLIEAGDVIKFIYRGEEYISDVTKHGEFCMVSITPHWEASINAVEIKSIVTKEQFQSMEYEVNV